MIKKVDLLIELKVKESNVICNLVLDTLIDCPEQVVFSVVESADLTLEPVIITCPPPKKYLGCN